MFNIYPQIYLNIYVYSLLFVVLATIYKLTSGNYKRTTDRTGAFLFALFILFFIGLRPYNVPGVGIYFGDTLNYYNLFLLLASGGNNITSNDLGFDLLTRFCAATMSGQAYFFILAALYILPIYYACKRLSLHYTFLLFLMISTSFLFWANGVNGIRSGIATSFLLLAITYKNKIWVMLLLFALAITFHKSMLLPIGAFALSSFYKNSKGYIFVWCSSIVLSLLFGGFWENFFASFNVGDDRYTSYLTSEVDSTYFSSTGFRWDFVLYSFIPIALGGYFIFKKHFKSEIYIQLFNTYLLANSFWILVIRANYSNRFASLSWFIIPIILIFPLIKIKVWEKQMAKISLILFLSFAFTYYLQFNLLWK